MSHAKSVAAVGAAAMLLCGCGAVVKPPQGRGQAQDPRTSGPDRFACLLAHHLPARKTGQAGIQIGALPGGPTVQFTATPGGALERQVDGRAQGAELIGSALLYPHQASDAELTKIENCLDLGVSG
jgi:hypothetical protein